jgi:LysM domain
MHLEEGSKGRRGGRFVAFALVALCWAACLPGAAAAQGARLLDQAPAIKLNQINHGKLYDHAWYSGYSVAYWTASLAKGDRVTIVTDASGTDAPPCQLLYLPGAAPDPTAPLLNPTFTSRKETHDVQRFEPVEKPGTYTLTMSNADIYLSGPFQCLDAPADRPFTFKVTVAHRGSSTGSEKGSEKSRAKGSGSSSKSTQIVAPGQSLWVIAQNLVANPFSVAQVALKVDRLWALNAARIGTGDRNLIFPGQELRLK